MSETPIDVKHDFEPFKADQDKKSQDEKHQDQKSPDFSNSAIVVVGTTGTGKSSLINLFCGSNVKIGHGVASETTSSNIFMDQTQKDRYWLDSQGGNDSQGVEDEKVLTDILKTLYDKSIGSIRVIWCIEGGRFARAKYEFKTQSKFIQSLGSTAWDSTIIIQKGGKPKPKGIDGLLAAAREYGSNIDYGDDRLFGFTGLDYGNGAHLKDDDHYQDLLEDFGDNQKKLNQKFDKFGYYTNDKIKEHVNQRLSGLSTLQIKFTISKCTKCGIKGDTRFIFAPCHVASEQHHPKQIESYHPEKRTSRRIHSGSVQARMYHPGDLVPEYYHSGYWKTERYHSSGTISYKYFLFNSWSWGEKHSCCGKEKGSSGCEETSGYTCCNYSHGSSGCCTRYVYSCCGSSSSGGCEAQNYYTCCDRGGDGCETEYYYPCCNRDGDGCEKRWECCEKDPNEEGCETRCSNADCYKEWGEGPGCTKTTKDKS